MRSSSTDGCADRGTAPRGTWVRLGALLILAALLAASPAPDRTGAVLTDTDDVAVTVWTTVPPATSG